MIRGLIFGVVIFFFLSARILAQPDLIVQNGHSQGVKALALSQDGKYLASGGETIKIWDLNLGKEIATLSGHGNAVTGLAFNPGAKILASGSYDGKLILWNPEKRKIIKEIEVGYPIVKMFFEGDLIYTNGNATLRIWDYKKGREITHRVKKEQILQSDEKTKKMRIRYYSPDGKYLCEVKNITETKVNPGKSTFRESLYKIGNPGSAASPDGERIAVAQYRSIKFFDIENGAKLFELTGDALISSIEYSPDGKMLISSCNDSLVYLWNLEKRKLIMKFVGHEGKVNRAVFSEDGRYIVSASEDKTLILWDAESGNIVRKFEGNASKAYQVKFSPDMDYIALACENKRIKMFDLNSGKSFLLPGHLDAVECIDFSPSGNMLASGSRFNTIRSWNLEDFENENTFLGHDADIINLKYAFDGKIIASLDKKGVINLFDSQSRFIIRSFISMAGTEYRAMDVGPDGMILAAGLSSRSGDEAVHIYNVLSGELVKKFYWRGAVIKALSFDKKGEYLAASTQNGELLIWDLNSGKIYKKIETYPNIINAIDFHPSNTLIAYGGNNGRVYIRNLDKWEGIQEYRHEAAITSIDFSPDAKFLASGAEDGRVKIRDLTHNKIITTIISLKDNDWAAISPEGVFDASGDGMKLIHYVEDMQAIPLDAFFEKLYRPGLLETIFSEDNQPQRAAEFSLDKRVKLPPAIKIISPNFEEKVRDQRLEISAEIIDRGGGIDEVRLYHNRKLIDEAGIKKKTARGASAEVSFSADLMQGSNIFKIVAFNKERTESSEEFFIDFSCSANSKTAKSDLYILSIGINEYENNNYNLNYGRPDAEAFVKKLQSGTSGIYENVYLHEIYDSKANKNIIDSVFNEIIKQSKPSDTFIFYYAGHGAMVEGKSNNKTSYYFILHDVTRIYDYERDFVEKCISAAELKEYCRKIKAMKQLIVMDACHSGGAVEEFAARGALEEKAIMQLSRSAGVVALASSGSEQIATEFRRLGHGVFTFAIIKGMSGAADNGDGKLTVREIDSYLNDKVPELTQKYRSKKQYPCSSSEGHDFPVIIVK